MASTTTAQKVGLQYKALQGDDIRLLTIGPHQPFSHSLLNYDSRVRCLLKHYPLGQPDSSSTLKTTLLARENIWSASCRDPGIRVKDKTDISQHPLMREYAQPAARGSFGSYMRAKHFHEGRSAEEIVKGSQAQTVRGRYPWGDFFALSYTWGDPNDMREILVNDVSVQVTANLEAALRQLQKKAPIKAGVKVWIDALCLNQGDDAEKAVQVPRMRDIYGQALDVIVWLGREYENSAKAFRLIEVLAASWREDEGAAMRKFLDSDEHSFYKLFRPDEPSLLGCWHGLRKLMQRQYWDRVWIIQEMLMCSDSSPILCGNSAVQFRQFMDAVLHWLGPKSLHVVRRYMIYERLHMAAGHQAPLTGDSKAGETIVDIAERFGGLSFDPVIRERKGLIDSATIEEWAIDTERLLLVNRLKATLEGADEIHLHPANLVACARDSDASRPHDKVYALLGLMDPDFVKRIPIDYKQPEEAAYSDFSIQWMLEAQTLDLLTYCRLEDNQSPTWVPNWRTGNFMPLLYIGDHKNPYTAGGEELGPTMLSPDKKLLCTTAVIIDLVDGLSAQYDEPATSIVQPSSDANAYETPEGFRDALWRTFLGNRDFDFNPPHPGSSHREFRALLDFALPEKGGHLPAPYDQYFYKFIETNEDFRLAGKRLVQYFPNDGRRLRVPTDAASVQMMKNVLLDSISRATLMQHRRRLITTKIGLVGMAPAVTKKGDTVAVILGCREPLVLRPVEQDGQKCFKVVGACYLHGLMEGELMRSGIMKTCEIVLC